MLVALNSSVLSDCTTGNISPRQKFNLRPLDVRVILFFNPDANGNLGVTCGSTHDVREKANMGKNGWFTGAGPSLKGG